ncbi:MAG: NTP transferase domain-containing protein [Bacteroidetes bacterium]|nr:NTP transferase domain-containing protein [Bacteroidota bacterium]
MILSAGFGTRLHPYTNKLPKALISYKGKPMIEHQIDRLKKIGVSEIVVNAHHFWEKICEHFRDKDFGIKINVLVEKNILGTGGGIINAGKFLAGEDYFMVINVDVNTDMDLSRMVLYNMSVEPFATLAVQKRFSKRYLELDDDMNLLRRENDKSVKHNLYAFNGIHIISNRIFNTVINADMSDILDVYFKALKSGETVKGYDAGKCLFRDLGRKENLFAE